MNPYPRILAATALTLAALSAHADIFNDPSGDVAVPGAPFPHIDLTSVTVTNTATDITFALTLNGDPVATNWGKYNIIMRTPGGGASGTGNGWGRPYSLDGGANRFIGGWADQATDNTQIWAFSGGAWTQTGGTTSTISTTGVSYKVSLADLGLTAGDALVFDVVTTAGGNGDGAVDALSNPNPQITDWGQTSTVSGVTYNVAPVPEPASMAALGLGAAAMLRRRRKA